MLRLTTKMDTPQTWKTSMGCIGGQGKDHKHIHQDPLLNTRIRRKGRRGEVEGEEWKIWVSQKLKIKVHPHQKKII